MRFYIILCTYIVCVLSRNTQPELTGIRSHFCGDANSRLCCPGWHNGLGTPCSIPSCAGNCGERGRCVKPNICLCQDGRMRFNCDPQEEEFMQSDQATDICPEHCSNQGKCMAGKCICDRGYSGTACEIALEAPCYVKLHRGLCVSAIQHDTAVGNVTTKLTREVCCNVFGLAWGEPCQVCRPNYCGRGSQQERGGCRDINECQIPGVCRGGHCTNMDGSYICKCPNGYKYDESTLECIVNTNACERGRGYCHPGGKCITKRHGDFECVCNRGFLVSPDRKSCTPKQKITFDLCKLYSQSICKNGVCIPRDGSYECICNDGFEISADRKGCRHKIDVCAIHRGFLCKNGECVPVGREFYCKCNPGFSPSFDRQRCLSQCERVGPAICPNGQCIATPQGDYECQCHTGYQNSVNKKHCVPVDDIQSGSITGFRETDQEYSPWTIFRRPGPNHLEAQAILLPTAYQQDNAEPTYRERFQTRLIGYDIAKTSPYHKNTPPCEQPQISANCAGGFCLNLGGSAYQCECLPGFRSTAGGRNCISLSDYRK